MNTANDDPANNDKTTDGKQRVSERKQNGSTIPKSLLFLVSWAAGLRLMPDSVVRTIGVILGPLLVGQFVAGLTSGSKNQKIRSVGMWFLYLMVASSLFLLLVFLLSVL